MYGGKVLKQGLELFSSFASGSNDAAVLHAPFICSRTPTTAADLTDHPRSSPTILTCSRCSCDHAHSDGSYLCGRSGSSTLHHIATVPLAACCEQETARDLHTQPRLTFYDPRGILAVGPL